MAKGKDAQSSKDKLMGEAIKAGGKLIGSVVTSAIEAKTQREFNEAQIRQMEADRNQATATAAEKRAIDLKIAVLKKDNKNLTIIVNNLTKLGVSKIDKNADILIAKINKQDKTLYIVGGIAIALIAATVWMVNKK